ncbi:MAG TPA: AMIN domain-containing protein [Oculatellaceae cyanobacterium]|jgi:N-acetylmuramoyl-L-alanine amidase
MRLNWILISCLSFIVFSLPAKAGQLVDWRFEPNTNRLSFRTNSRVQPKAMLIFEPTRLVIDLPGTNFEQPTVKQRLNGTISSLRVGQLDDSTTRLVIELQPGYTLDSQKIQFQGATPQRWSVQIPSPQRVERIQRL